MPALDDELAKDTGEAETLEGLRDKVRERLVETTSSASSDEMAQQLVKELVKRNEFPIAPALVERYAQLIVNRAKTQLTMGASTSRRSTTSGCGPRFTARREEEARGAILIQAIAEREGIAVTDADMQKRIAELAPRAEREPEEAARRAREGAAHPAARGADPRTEDA